MKTYLIRTFGCQMNKHDSERVAGLLGEQGLAPVEDTADADVIVFMTCCVRENADERLRGQVRSLKSVKAGRPGQLIAVGGCIGQRDGETLLRTENYEIRRLDAPGLVSPVRVVGYLDPTGVKYDNAAKMLVQMYVNSMGHLPPGYHSEQLGHLAAVQWVRGEQPLRDEVIAYAGFGGPGDPPDGTVVEERITGVLASAVRADIRKRLGIPDEKVFVNLSRYGNTSAASIPIALAEARAQGRLKKGDLVLLAAFGAGLTWGSVLLRI